MKSDPSNPRSNRLCRQLRSKEMFYEAPAAPGEGSASGIYWCGRTQKCLGPDDKPVGADHCSPQRGCYR